jgi:hypothetical protein
MIYKALTPDCSAAGLNLAASPSRRTVVGHTSRALNSQPSKQASKPTLDLAIFKIHCFAAILLLSAAGIIIIIISEYIIIITHSMTHTYKNSAPILIVLTLFAQEACLLLVGRRLEFVWSTVTYHV